MFGRRDCPDEVDCFSICRCVIRVEDSVNFSVVDLSRCILTVINYSWSNVTYTSGRLFAASRCWLSMHWSQTKQFLWSTTFQCRHLTHVTHTGLGITSLPVGCKPKPLQCAPSSPRAVRFATGLCPAWRIGQHQVTLMRYCCILLQLLHIIVDT